MHFLKLIQRNLRPYRYFFRVAVQWLVGKKIFLNLIRLSQDSRAFDGIPQLADISPPSVRPEFAQRGCGKG